MMDPYIERMPRQQCPSTKRTLAERVVYLGGSDYPHPVQAQSLQSLTSFSC